MRKTTIKYGIIGGICLMIVWLLIYVVKPTLFANFLLAYLMYIPLIICMVFGVKEIIQLNESSRYDFRKLFSTSFQVGIIGFLLFFIFTFIMFSFVDDGLSDMLQREVANNTAKFMEKVNAPQESIDEAMDKIYETDFSIELKNLHTVNGFRSYF